MLYRRFIIGDGLVLGLFFASALVLGIHLGCSSHSDQITKVPARAVSNMPDTCRRESIRVMSFNIRYDNPRDGMNAWPYRKELAASMIRFHGAELVGLQEALKHQLDDLARLLPDYAWVGVGRDDGKFAGEFSAILYRHDRFEVLQQSTFWLSETPGQPSKGWDAACVRIVTWAKFKDRFTGRSLFHFNTHFDHRGESARRESARLLRAQVKKIAATEHVIVTGDLNSLPDSEPYGILTGKDARNEDAALVDARLCSVYGHHGPTGTLGKFETTGIPGEQIDYIFVKNRVTVLLHGILSDTFDGRFPSDHLPVLAEISFQR